MVKFKQNKITQIKQNWIMSAIILAGIQETAPENFI